MDLHEVHDLDLKSDKSVSLCGWSPTTFGDKDTGVGVHGKMDRTRAVIWTNPSYTLREQHRVEGECKEMMLMIDHGGE